MAGDDSAETGSGRPGAGRGRDGPAPGPLPSEMPAAPPGTPIGHEDLEAIIRRAAELQFAAGGEETAVDEAELLRIGEEVGLDARFVRQALTERRAAALVPPQLPDTGLPARLWGPAIVRDTRVVPGDRDELASRIEVWLREGESLRQLRDRRGRSVWEPASDLWSELQRGFDLSGRGYELAGARRVELTVEQLEPGRSLVIMTADLRNKRAGHAAGWLLGGALPAGLAAGLLAVTGLDASAALVFPAAGSAALAAGVWAAGRTFRRRRERVQLAIEGLLDRLEQGLPPRPSRRGWLDRLGLDWRARIDL